MDSSGSLSHTTRECKYYVLFFTDGKTRRASVAGDLLANIGFRVAIVRIDAAQVLAWGRSLRENGSRIS